MKGFILLVCLVFFSLTAFSQQPRKAKTTKKTEEIRANDKESRNISDSKEYPRQDYPDDVKIGVSVFYIHNDKPVSYSEWIEKQKK